MAKIKIPSRHLEVTRVADIRGPGAKTLYAHGYAELADILGTEPILVAECVAARKLDPLNVVELVLARRHGVVISSGEQTPYDTLVAKAKAMRPVSVTEVCIATPPLVEAPYGLTSLWAYTYSDLASQVGASPSATRGHRQLDMTSLRSIVDYVEARHPLTK